MSKFMNRPPPPMMSTASVPNNNNSIFVEKLLIGLDHAPAAFDLRGQLLGSNGANLNYIRNETGANPTLRGRGSMFIDPVLGAESQEPLHMHIEHTRFDGLQNAKQLVRNLIETLQQELVHFQQANPPVSAAVQYTQQSNTQTVTQVMSGTSNVSPQMSMLAQIPPPMLAVPPPQIQSTPMMQQNIPQPQTVPIQLHRSSNMVIQQQQPVQNATNVSIPMQGNLNVPPPSIGMAKPQFVSQVQLSQPPPNLQNPVATQIVLNQPTAYQYIQTTNPDQNHQQGQVTIQHIYQNGGIVQQTTQPVSHFTQQATSVRPSQQYIIQGNTAYPCIIPPPNIMQPPPVQSISGQQNIIFQTNNNPTNQMQLQQLQLQAPPQMIDNNQATHMNGNDPENGSSINEDKPNLDPNQSPIKTEIKSEPENHEIHENGGEQLPQSMLQSQIPINVNVPPPIQLAQTQLMAAPPHSTVQHIVGNTLITSSQPQGTQTHQIYNQIPVPLQQIQATTSQAAHHQPLHVSSGQHIFVNQFQPMTHNLQSFQITTQPRQPAPNEIVMVSNQTIVANPMNQSPTTNIQAQPPTGIFNPHTAPPPVVHFQQICQPQQVLQTIDAPQQIIEHTSNHFQMQHTQIQSISGGNPSQSMSFIQQQPPMPQDQPRLPMKRKRSDDDNNQPPRHMMLSRLGMGSNNGGQQQQAQQFLSNIQRDVQQMQSTTITTANNIQTSNSLPIYSTSAATMTTANNQQDEPLSVNFNNNNNNNFKPQMDGNEHFYRMPPMSMAQSNAMGNMMMNMPPRGPPRFSGNNNPGNQMHRMNFGPPPMPQMPQGQRPRYMNR